MDPGGARAAKVQAERRGEGQERPLPLPDGPLFSTESRRTAQQTAGYRARPSPVLVEPHLDGKLSARAVSFRIRITVHIRSVLPRACVTSRCLVITSIIYSILTSTAYRRVPVTQSNSSCAAGPAPTT